MRSFTIFIATLELLLASNSIHASSVTRGACTVKKQYTVWQNLSDADKASYIDAELCLMAAPPRADVLGAENVWDELTYAHAAQSDYIRNVGAFLPFHRYMLAAHATLLEEECGYRGPIPYDVGAIAQATIFDPITGFGGNGSGASSCITDGPFVNAALRIEDDLSAGSYCLSRAFNEADFDKAAQANVDACLTMTDFVNASDCIGGNLLFGGHAGVNGVMASLKLSPGDPLFYLHHGWLNKLWWDWEAQDLPARLTAMGGPNTPPGIDDPNFVDYFNDGGNVTTLNHVLWSHGIVPNATIADVMDIGGDYVCAEFV
ncbi:hypothetical protein F5Y03DRAFT_387695 [Xylaria venustula]|nr:hypothetical protein F5Y03DRAFT_387695 [Xylaria venustula]